MKYEWKWPPEAGEKGQRLVDELGISPLLAQLLCNRQLDEPQVAWTFLHPRLEDLHDPYRMRDMKRVVERLLRARQAGESVLVYGDYDVDGITSTVVLRRALQMLGVRTDFYIPRRLEEGYGLRREVLEEAQRCGHRLVISVDSGIRAFEACQAARRMGLDLIVTDHHLPDRELPPAYAILNPRRADCSYPDKDLAAVGVVFKLVQALFREEGRESVIPHFLKLVAIGTIADIVPLRGENRIFTRFGLEGLADPRNLGLQALLRGAGVEPPVNHFDVGFRLAPRINAVTRMGGGREVVDLFSLEDAEQARLLVEGMNRKNARRQQQEQQILEEIQQRVRQRPQDFQAPFLVVSGRDWHRGVIGIVASRLVERFYRPVLVFSVGERDVQGSGRSIPGFHLLEALDECRHLLDRYGGHAQAVGCTFSDSGRLPELTRRLQEVARRRLTPEDLVPRLNIDALLPAEQVHRGLYEEIQSLAPFGNGNPVPLFASRGVPVAEGPFLLKERHLKIRVQCNGSALDAIWWKNAGAADRINAGCRVDLAYVLASDTFRGEERLVLTIRDLIPQS